MFIHFPFTESMGYTTHYPLNLFTHPTEVQGMCSNYMSGKVQSTYQLQPQSEWTHHWICQRKIHFPTVTSLWLSISAVGLSCTTKGTSHEFCCIWHSCLFTPFPLAAIAPLLLIVLTYPALQLLDKALEVFRKETGFLFKRQHCSNRKLTFDSMPEAGEQICLSHY